MRFRRPTPEAIQAAQRFNNATGWYAATPVGNRVVIRVDAYLCGVLVDSYLEYTWPDEDEDEGVGS